MNLKFWERKTPAPESAPEKKSHILGLNDELSAFLTYGSSGAETPASAINLYNKSSAVSIPINKIAEAFSGIEPVLMHDDGKIETNHEVLELLQHPGPFFDSVHFLETIAKDYLVTNEAEIVALGNVERPPVELQPISPKNLTVNEGSGGYAASMEITGSSLTGRYDLNIKKGRARYLDGNLRELKMIRGYSTKNNSLLRGESLLVSAAYEARQHILGNKHNVKILEKGGRVSLVFHYEEDVNSEDFEDLKQRVRKQFGGPDGESIVVSTGEKLSIEELGKTAKDMDFVKLQRMAMNSVALQYKCPLALISTDASTFNNYKEAKLALFDDAVIPLFVRIYAGLSSFLLPRYGMDPRKIKLWYDPLSITVLRERILEEIKLRKDINIESDNELREAMAREPYEGGDAILKPANLLPVGTDLVDSMGEPIVIRDQNEPAQQPPTEEVTQ